MAAWLLGKPTILLALVAVVAVALWGFSCQCRKILNPPKPRPPRTNSYTVVSVLTGATIEVATGLRDRRTVTVTLLGIAAPIDGPLAEQSRANLQRLAGATIRVETDRHGLLRADPYDSQRRLDENGEATAESPVEPEPDPVASRWPVVGVVFGESGACLNVEQLASGMAKALDGTPKEWRKIEDAARKQRIGIWRDQQ